MSNQTISYLLNCPTLLPSHSLSAENLFFTSQKCRHTQIKTPSKSWTPSTKTWCIKTSLSYYDSKCLILAEELVITPPLVLWIPWVLPQELHSNYWSLSHCHLFFLFFLLAFLKSLHIFPICSYTSPLLQFYFLLLPGITKHLAKDI